MRIERLAAAVNPYQTEFLVAAHPLVSSAASSVACTVVPRTLAGSGPSACAAARASLGGGAATAAGAPKSTHAPALTSVTQRAKRITAEPPRPACLSAPTLFRSA
jgi:hypothetical protein